MAYSTHDVLRSMEADSGVAARELRVDGGASENDWLMRFQAGLVDLPVRRPALVETTALGAGALAGLAEGVWSSADGFLSAQPDATVFDPAMEEGRRRRLLSGWSRAVDTAIAWARHPGAADGAGE